MASEKEGNIYSAFVSSIKLREFYQNVSHAFHAFHAQILPRILKEGQSKEECGVNFFDHTRLIKLHEIVRKRLVESKIY